MTKGDGVIIRAKNNMGRIYDGLEGTIDKVKHETSLVTIAPGQRIMGQLEVSNDLLEVKEPVLI